MIQHNLFSQLKHPHVVQFFGIYTSPMKETFMVLEFMAEGSLDKFLARMQQEISVLDLVQMVKHTIAGMSYLEQNNIVHRDLALRNLLVSKVDGKYTVKVSDFGMSRSTEKGYYQSEEKSIPVKWSAPEVLEYGRSTSRSDVWSFGVCLWEMFSYGKLPYPGMSNIEVANNVLRGYRMEAPLDCPTEVYEIMVSCWKAEPENRPTFGDLLNCINNILLRHPQESPVLYETAKVSHYN
jgi:serine/threonine protein kinase